MKSPCPSRIATGAALLALGCVAHAQDRLERVEITGTAIKRIEGETALPVQVITRADIDKAGVTTAAELLSKVSANVGGLTDGVSINVGGDQRGFNAANLRGIGTGATLVLLNGRRMANFASPGDDAGVDLNNIPAAAIQRVEILLDGASALYGSDAIGGVVNFITRRDYQGAEVNVYAGKAQEGGAGKRSASFSLGLGDIARDGFNAFLVVDAQKTARLGTEQRQFIGDLNIPERLGHLLSGYTMPANIRLSSDQRTRLQQAGFLLNGKPIENRTINLSLPDCNPPANLYLPAGTGGVDACTYNYMGDTELYPDSSKTSLLGRGALKLSPDTEAYAEVALARARTRYVGSSARIEGLPIPASLIPGLAAYHFDQPFTYTDPDTGDPVTLDAEPDVTLRGRLFEAGRRTSTLTSTGQRIVVGLTGLLAGWDYDIGLNRSVNRVGDRDTHGYLLADQLAAGLYDGRINPFGASTVAGKALLDGIQVDDKVRDAKGVMTSLDAKMSKALWKLDGGDLSAAFGAEWRREQTDFTPSKLLLSDNINNDGAPEGGRATSDSRRVMAVYTEWLLPFTRQFEVQLSARYDRYQAVGGAASPKIGARYLVTPQWLLRASVGQGFRAPTLTDLHRPTVYSSTATLADPVICAQNDNDLSVCADNWDTRRYSNPNLKPERSRQFSMGTVWEPAKGSTLGLDYWNIKRTRLISEIGDDVILGNLAKYGSLVHRLSQNDNLPGCDYDPSDDTICYIELRKENRGAQKASGVDVNVDLRGLKTAVGSFGLRINGTLVLNSKLQTSPGDEFISNLGRFVTKGVVQRWRHRISLDWESGDWGLTLANSYSSSYTDQNNAINTDDGSIVSANRVRAYSIWDLSGSWAPAKAWTVRAGVLNLANTAPPFSNQAYFFLSGYDPSYTDPRGRFYYASLRYAFR